MKTNYGLVQQFDLGTDWKRYTVDFTTTGFTGTVNDGRLRFRLYGKNNDAYWLDGVSLVELGTQPPAATPTSTASPTAAAAEAATATPTPTATETVMAQSPTPSPTSADVASCSPQPGELLANGNFEEGSGDWHFHTNGSGSFAASSPAYSCGLAGRIKINLQGRIMQFYQYGVPLKANTPYRLTFAAYSASGNDLTAELLQHTSPYTNYGLVQQFDLGTEWQLYTVDFTTTGFAGTVNDGRLRFRLHAKNNDTYWMDWISLQEIE